jgi:hypothetical protein
MRRYRTDYAGAWSGYCKTIESAIVAAARHVVLDGYTRATITDRETGLDVARVRLNAARTRAVIETARPLPRRA